MKVFDNVTEIVRDDMQQIISRGSKVSVAAACFSCAATSMRAETSKGLRAVFS